MASSPQEPLINPETGEEITEEDLEEIKLVSLTGNKLVVYLPEEMQWYTGPDGEQRGRQIGGNAVQFTGGLYPIGDQSIPKPEARLLFNHEHYGKLFKIAAPEQDVESTEGMSAEELEADVGEDEVVLDGEIVSKEEAMRRLQGDGSAEESTGDEAPDDEIEEVSDSATSGKDFQVLTGPNNRTEALEALANQGVEMDDAPPPSATSEEIQKFAVSRGFVIDKYDLPEDLG